MLKKINSLSFNILSNYAKAHMKMNLPYRENANSNYGFKFDKIIAFNFSTKINENFESANNQNVSKIIEIIETHKSQLEKNNFDTNSLNKYLNTVCDCKFYFKNYAGLKQKVEDQFIQTLDKIVQNNKITEDNANIIIPLIINSALALNSKDNTSLWDKLENLLVNNSENLTLTTHLTIIKTLVENLASFQSDRLNRIKSNFFELSKAFEKEDYLNLDLNLFLLYLAMYATKFDESYQELLDQITQILIKSHTKRMFTDEFIDMTCATLFNLMSNPKINTSFLLEKLLDDAYKNINCLNFNNQRCLLTAYRIFIEKAGYTKISVFFKIVKKMVKLVSEDISLGNLEKLELLHLIDLVDTISRFEVSASEVILESEKLIGKNIEKIPPRMYVYILDAFIKSKSYRDKFLVLMQNKIYEHRSEISIADLCRMMRMVAVLKLANQSFFEIMQDHLLSLKNQMDDEQIANFIFAYSNLKISYNHVLNDMENIVEGKIISWANNRHYVIIIDILQSYLIAQKGENSFIEKIKNVILHSGLNSDEIDEMSVYKLYKVFVDLKLSYNDVKLFDSLLRKKLKYYEKEEFEVLRKFLEALEYKNEKTIEIVNHLVEISVDSDKKLSYLNKFELV